MTTAVKWTPEQIKAKLNEDMTWVYKGIVAIYKRQTSDEQSSERTKHVNGRGFSAFDAEIGSSFARQIMNWQAGYSTWATPLSEKQRLIARKIAIKYAKQLAAIANGEK